LPSPKSQVGEEKHVHTAARKRTTPKETLARFADQGAQISSRVLWTGQSTVPRNIFGLGKTIRLGNESGRKSTKGRTKPAGYGENGITGISILFLWEAWRGTTGKIPKPNQPRNLSKSAGLYIFGLFTRMMNCFLTRMVLDTIESQLEKKSSFNDGHRG
jgi:hypothetical protein